MAGIHYIFHLAAAYREAGLPDGVYRKVHVESTRLFAIEAKKNKDFKRFIHISTVGVHGHIEHPPANEDAPFSPGDIYQKTKAEAEEWLRKFATESQLPYTIIRPAAIYGPGDKRLLKLFKMAAMPYFIVIGNGKTLYHLVHVDDLTDAIILAAVHPSAVCETFICGSPQPKTIEEIGKIISDALNKPFRPVHLPVTPFFMLADICEMISKLLRIKPIICLLYTSPSPRDS